LDRRSILLSLLLFQPSAGEVDWRAKTMKRVLTEVLQELAPPALVGVFASYGVSVREQATAEPFQSISTREAIAAGLVGFTGASFRGTLIMAAPFALIANARPKQVRQQSLSRESSADWIFVRDWIGELANQVLGRIKNQLHLYNVVFDVSPPAALSGSTVAFAAPKGPSPRSHTFMAGQEKVWLCLDAVYDSARTVSLDPSRDSGSREGKIIEF
jgi:CheY-specific phosphatase CheX